MLQAPRDALARLGSSREGLAEEEAARRLATHGPNALAETRGASPLIYLLLGAVALTAATVFAAMEIDKLFARVGAH